MAAADGAAAVFVTGDSNEPSHRDRTSGAVAAGRVPVAVKWPTTLRLSGAGIPDTCREVFPDPAAKPAPTGTPRHPGDATDDHPDRIAVVWADGAKVAVAAITGWWWRRRCCPDGAQTWLRTACDSSRSTSS